MKKRIFKFLLLAVSISTFLGDGKMEAVAEELKFTVPLGKIIESDDPAVCGAYGPYPRDVVDMAREILTNFEYEIFTPEAYGDELIYFATGVNEDGLTKIDMAMNYLANIAGMPVAKKEDRPNAPYTHFLIFLNPDQSKFSENEALRKYVLGIPKKSDLNKKSVQKKIADDLELINNGGAVMVHSNYINPVRRRYLYRTNPLSSKLLLKNFLAASMMFSYDGMLFFSDAKSARLEFLNFSKSINSPTLFKGEEDIERMSTYILKYDRLPPLEESLLRMAYGHDVCVIIGDEKAII